MDAVRAGGIVVAALWLWLAGPAEAAPHWNSDQVRAARSVQAVEAVVFEAKTAEGVSRVALAPDFTLISGPGEQRLFDHALCRWLLWKPGEPGFDNESCYALPAFLQFEVRNRAMLAQVLQGAARSRTAPDPYWAEAELGLQFEAKDRLTRQVVGDGVEYRLGRRTVVRLMGSAGELSPEEMRRFTRFLTVAFPLHPQVRRDLAGQSRAPARIEVETERVDGAKGRKTLEIGGLAQAQTAYPLPPGLTARVRLEAQSGAGLRGGALRAVLAAIDDGSAGKPSLTTLVAELDGASPLQVLLLFSAITQQYPDALVAGPESQALRGQVMPRLRAVEADPVVAGFLTANHLAGDPSAVGDRQAAAAFLANLKAADGLRFGTWRNLTLANLVRYSRDSGKWNRGGWTGAPPDPIVNYWIHIGAYPWASNAYKDLGDAYFQGLEVQKAWQAFDLGRAVDPNWKRGVMVQVDRYEGQLRQAMPDFF